MRLLSKGPLSQGHQERYEPDQKDEVKIARKTDLPDWCGNLIDPDLSFTVKVFLTDRNR